MGANPSLDNLGDALLGSQLRRMELRIMARLDEIALQVEQQAVDKETLESALGQLKSTDVTIDAIEPDTEGTGTS